MSCDLHVTLPLDLDAIQTKLDDALIAAEGEKSKQEVKGEVEVEGW